MRKRNVCHRAGVPFLHGKTAFLKFLACFRRRYGILLFDEFYGRRRTEWENN
ncbi:hypothetical protein GK107_15020 [Geobacillus thermoleovorans]|uniref:Transposase n=1 Tax=Geobacillus thermoleovorans CCB_US3_UF5 TaxID=1111068 RepID=A0ABN4A2C4_GEOTH|nr:hypothetical protein GTCCBUS3UF5_34390 [Geobacillus thermoleovorans CCB_US3_UF5]UPT60577.1 hypothetical protein GK107_15020 [Geobacillus thermoleovorans]